MTIKSKNCDGDKCTCTHGEVRRLPTGGGSNAILCRTCYRHEMSWRMERNKQLSPENHYDFPRWEDLVSYSS